MGTENARAGPVRAHRFRGWLPWVAASVGACAFALAVNYAASLRAYTIPTGSMRPTLTPGDRVCVQAAGNVRPKRGEVWVFHMPPGAIPRPGQGVKRIVGLPGETVAVASGRVWIDGRAWNEPPGIGPMDYTLAPLTLGSDEYFVLGDSRNTSNDSHLWGPLSARNLVGPVKLRYWPLKRIGGL